MSLLGDVLEGIAGSINDRGCDWYCDGCGAYLNSQPGFTTDDDIWECTECGEENDVSDDNIVDDDYTGILREYDREDGTTETVRFTKTREVHDILDSDGNKKCSVWRRR